MAISSGDNETIAISDMTYNEIMDMGTLVKEGFLMKNPSRQGNFQLGFTKQRFIVLHTDRLMWFKKGEASDCLLGEVPITESTEVIKHAANLLGPEKITVKTGSKELDLMPIKLGEIALWAEAVEEQIELARTVGIGKAGVMPLGGLCQCLSEDLTRVLSGMMYMASKSLGCVPKPAGEASAVA